MAGSSVGGTVILEEFMVLIGDNEYLLFQIYATLFLFHSFLNGKNGNLNIGGNCLLLSERLPIAASLYPEEPALMRHGQTMSYGELYGLVERLGHALYVEGLRAGDRFALLGDPDPQLVVAFYAAVGIGAIPLVPSPMLTVPELAAIFQDAEPHMVIHDDQHADAAIAKASWVLSKIVHDRRRRDEEQFARCSFTAGTRVLSKRPFQTKCRRHGSPDLYGWDNWSAKRGYAFASWYGCLESTYAFCRLRS